MSEFSVTLQGVRSALDKNSVAADRLSSTAEGVRSVRSRLTFEIRQRSQIDARLNAVAQELEEHNASLRRLVTTGNNVCGLYQRTENSLLGLSAGAITWVQPQPNPDYVPGSGEGSQSILEGLFELCLDCLPAVLPGVVPPMDWVDFDLTKILDKLLDKLDVPGGGLLGDVTDYFESFWEFFTGDKSGLSGFADWANLADDSVGLWKGIYDVFKDLGATGTLFTEEMAQRVKGVGLIGSLLGTVGSFMDMMDTSGKSFEDIMEDTADFGTSGVKAGMSALKLIGAVGTLPAHIYTSIAECGFDFFAQIGESIHEYSADGWDSRDTAEVMIDASCEGLYSLGNALTLGGLGWLLDKVTGNEDGDYGAMFSETMKNGADAFSEWIVDTSQTVSEVASDVVDSVKDTAEDVWNGFVSGWNYVFG